MSLLVVGFGNLLAGDDGAGLAVAERLRALRPPAGLRVADGGTDVLRLASCLAGESDVWLVDALRRGAPPGTVHHLGHDELLRVAQPHRSAHELSLPEGLRWLTASDPQFQHVRFRLWGIEPHWLGAGQGLSAAVEWAVEAVAADILVTASRMLSGTAPGTVPERSARGGTP